MTLNQQKTMRPVKIITTALLCLLALTSCMDGDWDASDVSAETPYGNNDLQETNVMTIADLKTKYSSVVFNSTNSYQQITDDIQIKGRVTGNDVGGNIYNNVIIDDGTSAILICIAQSGLFGYLPVGQEILISLKDLYIGGYGQQPEIGVPYTNSKGSSYISRMSRYVWQQHFKLIGTPDASQVVPEEFDASRISQSSYLQSHCGKLMTIKGVSFSAADGTATYAPDDLKDNANCVSRNLTGYSSSKIVVRTSAYADFAASALPTGKVDITGIFTRYRNVWQIELRTEDDVKAAQ